MTEKEYNLLKSEIKGEVISSCIWLLVDTMLIILNAMLISPELAWLSWTAIGVVSAAAIFQVYLIISYGIMWVRLDATYESSQKRNP